MDGTEWTDLRATGKQFREPAASLQEYEDERGLKHTVVAFDEAYRGHHALTRGVELVRSFLGYPMVVGLVELSHADTVNARFAYPTGPQWTLKELLRTYSDLSLKMGLRAALEVAWLVGQILVEAAENGAPQGCFSHGGLTPWRIALRPEGDLIVFGHGLAQVEVLAHRADPAVAITADSVRYAPPERLAGLPEDLSSDLAALSAIVFEIATGQPLYAGHDVAEVSRAIGLAEAAGMLSRPNDKLPAPVSQLLARALLFDPDSRMPATAWLDEIGGLYQRYTDGESLQDAVARVRGSAPSGPPRRAARFIGTQTSYYTPEQLAAVAASEEASSTTSAMPAPEKVETRWSRPARRRADPAPEAEADAPPEPGPREAPAAAAPTEETSTRRRRRLREGAEAGDGEVVMRSREELLAEALADDDDDDEDPPEAAPPADADVSVPTDRPRRRSDVAAEAPPGRRRRRRPDESGA